MKGSHFVTVFVGLGLVVAGVIAFRGAQRFAQRELALAQTESQRPAVTNTRPAGGDAAVLPNAFVACDVSLPNPGAGIDVATMSPATVRLFRAGDTTTPVAARLNSSGAGDAIVLQPIDALDPGGRYVFEVTDGLKDTTGAAFRPFRMMFTVASVTRSERFPVAFEKVEMPDTRVLMPGTDVPSAYTTLTFGPDGKLYAGTFDGRIMRYAVRADGTLGPAETVSTVQSANRGPRIITGVVFDPKSTRDDPILWVGHGQMAFNEGRIEGADDWTGKISTLSGQSLGSYQDVVVGLPRAWKDHLNFQMAFGPDGAIYFCQGSHTSTGAPDKKWNFREERLLTAAVLRLDPSKLTQTPINVKTAEGGTYDPQAAGAPLTIYATGVRSGFDLLWHSNGRLYTGLNGAAAGGNTPGIERDAGGQTVPAIFDIKETTHDLLLKLERGGYYGHPNPTRGEYVLMGGNPTAERDEQEIASYPVGIRPEPTFKAPAYDFGFNVSPNGLTEFRGGAFDGKLDGCILVTRYSGGKDVVVLRPGRDGDIVEAITGIDGLTQFADPLDIIQHPTTGHLYVAEYSGRQITLLRPRPGASSDHVFIQRVE